MLELAAFATAVYVLGDFNYNILYPINGCLVESRRPRSTSAELGQEGNTEKDPGRDDNASSTESGEHLKRRCSGSGISAGAFVLHAVAYCCLLQVRGNWTWLANE